MSQEAAVEVSCRRMIARLCVFSSVLAMLDLWYWLTVDFGRFLPPSPGALPERLYYAGVTAAGPLGIAAFGAGLSEMVEFTMVGGLPAGLLVGASLYWRRLIVARLGGYLGILIWFFVGNAISSLRIT